MPLYKIEKINDQRFLAIWHIEETVHPLLDQLNLKKEDALLLDTYRNEKKKMEWLAARLTVKSLCEILDMPYTRLSKNEDGKPYLANSTVELSLSHSYPYVAAIIDRSKAVGIDLEQPSEKLVRVRHKFLNNNELISVQQDINILCIYWCAKETLYKIHSKKNLFFKENMVIEPFPVHGHGHFFARITGNNSIKRYKLEYRIETDYILTFNLD